MCPVSLDPNPPGSRPSVTPRRVHELFIALVLIVSVFLVFGRVTQADFVKWDDDINIYRNPHIGGLEASRLKWMLDALKARIAVPPIAAYLPHVPRISPYNGTAVAAPNKAAGSLSIASELPPTLRNHPTIQNHRAGNSIPLHSVLKTDGLRLVGIM